MVKTTYISLVALVIAFAISGCNPGIIDVPPPTVTDASAYFFPKDILAATFTDTTGAIFQLAFTKSDSTNAFHIGEQYGTSNYYNDTLSAVSGSNAITISGISPHSFIPLPAGYEIMPVLVPDTLYTNVPVNHIIGLANAFLLAWSNDYGLYYSTDAGNAWHVIKQDIFTKLNQITTFAVSGSIYIGTSSGYTFSFNSGLLKIQPLGGSVPNPISAMIFHPNVQTLCFSARDTVYQLDIMNATGPIAPINGSFRNNTSSNPSFNSLASYTSQGDTILIGGTSNNGLWVLLADTGFVQVGSPFKSTDGVVSLISTPSGIYCSTTNTIYFSSNGIEWKQLGTSFGNALLSYNSALNSVMAVSKTTGAAITFKDSLNSQIKHLSSVGAKTVYDVTALGSKYFVATENGVFALSPTDTGWKNTSAGLTTPTAVSRKKPGEIVLLHSQPNAISLDSSWQSDTLIKSTILSPITARIIAHYDNVTMPDSAKYPDVIEVRYAHEATQKVVDQVVPYWDILYARGIGPISIREFLNNASTAKIYRKK